MKNPIVSKNFGYYEFRGEVVDLEEYPGDHCELCGTGIRYQYFIEDDTHHNKNFVGSECIERWGIDINIQGHQLSADLLPEWARLDFVIKAIQKKWKGFDGSSYTKFFLEYNGYITLKQYNALVNTCERNNIKRSILLTEKQRHSKTVGHLHLVKLS